MSTRAEGQPAVFGFSTWEGLRACGAYPPVAAQFIKAYMEIER
ncbi:MAG: hypothetical protein WC356_02430 [Candidatus Micrarchaeia archaeon]